MLGLLTEQKDNTEEVAGLGQYSQAGARGVHVGLNSEGVGPRWGRTLTWTERVY